jgi:D-alanyl-D-alanine carboxypeptidase/D-alanyl-D-alanine-endopeptidase (penicillin-binding protein 4)
VNINCCIKSIKNILLLLIILFSANSFSQSSEYNFKVQNKIEAVLDENNFFKSSQISIDIFDLTDNKTVYQKNNELLFLPASNLKLLTTAAALKFLGKDYSFNTTLLINGSIIDSILFGSVIVKGGVDPLFSLDDLQIFSDKLNLLGIKSIEGDLIADCSIKDSVYWGSGWQWDDEPSSDAPHLSALNINSNSISISAKLSDEQISFSLFPKTDFVNVKTISSQSETDISITRNWLADKNEFTINYNNNISGSISIEESKRLNITKPEFYFLTLLKEKLLQNGILCKGNLIKSYSSVSGDSVFTINRSIEDVCHFLLKYSDNLSAEMLIYALASVSSTPANSQKGLTKVDSLISLIGLSKKDYRIVDGSGLSRYNLISSKLLVKLLVYLYKYEPEIFKIIFESLPVAGVDGTLKTRMLNSSAEKNVHAKTGTLAGVSALSGYLTNANGHLIAFSINIQNYIAGSSNARNYIDSICTILTSTK